MPMVEDDKLGGSDPYSASKACSEIVAECYRRSFHRRVATARAGNVIGGGDWSRNRIIPDLVRAVQKGEPAVIRNPLSTRPFQHVLDCLQGYLLLAEKLHKDESCSGGWNFGPDESRTVEWLADKFIVNWGDGSWMTNSSDNFKEAHSLELDSSKARARLGWKPRMNIDEAVEKTVSWYQKKEDAQAQIREYAGL